MPFINWNQFISLKRLDCAKNFHQSMASFFFSRKKRSSVTVQRIQQLVITSPWLVQVNRKIMYAECETGACTWSGVSPQSSLISFHHLTDCWQCMIGVDWKKLPLEVFVSRSFVRGIMRTGISLRSSTNQRRRRRGRGWVVKCVKKGSYDAWPG